MDRRNNDLKLNIIYLPTESLKPYAGNTRKHTDFDVDAIADSIRQFGFNNPIAIDSDDFQIVNGHGRFLAARKLGMKDVPCIRLDHLSEEERRAYAIYDNRTAELSEWDFDALEKELDVLQLDLTDINFDFDIPSSFDNFTERQERGERIHKTDRNTEERPSLQRNVFENFEKPFNPEYTGKYGIPAIYPTYTTGDKLLRFMDWKEVDDLSEYIAHFYVDDYTFMAAWKDPDKYVDRLRQFKAVIGPDFSLYTDMPLALQILSVYRRQWLSAYWQSVGLDVIPCAVWGDERSYAFCFDGFPKGGTISVSSVGAKNNPLFLDGYHEMIKRLNPDTILYYGGHMDGLTGNIIEIPPKYTQWEKYRGKSKK